MAADLVCHLYSAHGRADDNVHPLVFKLFGKRRAQLFAVLCVPENLGTLQVPVAVPSARQTEMPLQKHARFL